MDSYASFTQIFQIFGTTSQQEDETIVPVDEDGSGGPSTICVIA